jgi:hypothetical protein
MGASREVGTVKRSRLPQRRLAFLALMDNPVSKSTEGDHFKSSYLSQSGHCNSHIGAYQANPSLHDKGYAYR